MQTSQADAVRVLQLLETGEWLLTKVKPWSALTDEANSERAWAVERTEAPFSAPPKNSRGWYGRTPMEAFNLAYKELGLEMPKWCSYCKKSDHNDEECSCTREVRPCESCLKAATQRPTPVNFGSPLSKL